jgi:mono/diheme cytochrome c family protein
MRYTLKFPINFNAVRCSRIGFLLLSILFCSQVLTACDRGGDGVPQTGPDIVEPGSPDRFLEFINRQSGLAAGSYQIVAGTEALGDTGSFTITAIRDDDSSMSYTGNWPTTGSGGTDESSAANPRFVFEMPYSGGAVFEITSGTDSCLYLLDAGGSLLAGKTQNSECSNPETIDLPRSKINHEAHAGAYYAAIDPDNTRDTLQKWLDANDFGQPCPQTIPDCEVHVIFRDTRDLGYGRDMTMRRHADGGAAFYVRNYVVNALPGRIYTSLNLDAALAQDPRWHFASNAIEFSTYPYGQGEPRSDAGPFNTATGDAPLFTKYYSFTPRERTAGAIQDRALTVNLDNRGEKSMPGPCISCHGGIARPLLADGSFAPVIPGAVAGDTHAHLQAIEACTLGYPDGEGCAYITPDYQSSLRQINQAVLDSYRITTEQYQGIQGYWDAGFAAQLLKGWYCDPDNLSECNADDPNDYTLRDNDFNDEYVPGGWLPDNADANPPAGADALFREVIGPHCAVCHAKRGTDKAPGNSFSNYESFMNFAGRIETLVYEKGVMPLGLLNFDQFWETSGPGRAELLASHLPGFSRLDNNNEILRPGRPIAIPAAPFNTNVPVIVSAEGSQFANSYRWSIIDSPAGSAATLSDANAMRAEFDMESVVEGVYTLQLVVANSTSESEPVDIQINVDSTLPIPANIRFASDIRTVLQANPLGTVCTSCHADSGEPGVPVHFTDPDVMLEPDRDLYADVIVRVNFAEPLESKLLRKPSSTSHFGGVIGGFDIGSGDRGNYDLFLNWILQGAPR